MIKLYGNNELTDLLLGESPGQKVHVINGINSNVDSAEDITGQGGWYTGFDQNDTSLKVVSTSENDTLAGTHARKVTVYGLDKYGMEQTEVIDMGGTAGGVGTKRFSRVYYSSISLSGNGNYNNNEGTIRVQSADGAATLSYIPAELGESNDGVYTIPNNYIGVFSDIMFSIKDTFTAAEGGMWYKGRGIPARTRAGWFFTPAKPHFESGLGLILPPMTDIKLRLTGIVGTGNTVVRAKAIIVLKKIREGVDRSLTPLIS